MGPIALDLRTSGLTGKGGEPVSPPLDAIKLQDGRHLIIRRQQLPIVCAITCKVTFVAQD